MPEGVVGVRSDVTADASVRAPVDRAEPEWQRRDVLVDHAGIGAQCAVEQQGRGARADPRDGS